VGAWLRGEGCSVVHQIDASGPDVDHDATQRAATAVQPSPSVAETANARKQRLRARRDLLKATGVHDFLKVMALEEGVTRQRVKQLVGDVPQRKKKRGRAGLFSDPIKGET
jgi:hypothetical protein